MAEVLENSKYDGSEASASTHSLSFGFTATAGRLLILGLSAPGGAVTINSIDSGWVEISNGASGTRTFTPYWYYKIATGGETGVSLTYSASQAINWAVEEWSGLATSSVLDQAAENETYLNTSTTSLASGTTATLSISDGFAISFLACDVSSGWNAGTTVSDGYTTTGYNDQPGPGCGFAYKKLSGTSGASTTWSTTDAGEQTYAAIAVFKPAAGGAPAITGNLAATETGSDSAALNGSILIQGSIAATETGADATAITGKVYINGDLAVTEPGSDTAVITGSGALPAITGDLAATESGADTAAMAGDVQVQGDLAATETGADTAFINGSSTIITTGDLAATESGADSAAITGKVLVLGELAAFEVEVDSAAVTGKVYIEGALAATETGADVAAIVAGGVDLLKTATAIATIAPDRRILAIPHEPRICTIPHEPRIQPRST